MLIKTAKMIAREYMAETYAAALRTGFLTARGSTGFLQEDFGDIRYVPTAAGFVRNSNKTCNFDDTGLFTVTAGTFPTFAVAEDIICWSVTMPNSNAAGPIMTTGEAAAANGIIMRTLLGQRGIRFGDSGTGVGQTAALAASLHTAGVNLLVCGVLDRSNTTTGVTSYIYDLDNDVVLNDESAAHNCVATITTTGKLRLTGHQPLYGAGQFGFASDTLPTAWKADMVVIAKALIAGRS